MRNFKHGGTPRSGAFQQPSHPHGPLSMRDEARNTQHSHGFDRGTFDQGDQRLRTRPVQFTASKPLIPEEDLPLPQTTKLSPAPAAEADQNGRSPEKEGTTKSSPAESAAANDSKAPSISIDKDKTALDTKEKAHNDLFFVDLAGNKNSNGQAAAPSNVFPELFVAKVVTTNVDEEPTAPADSSSDGEVILFKGRSKRQSPQRQPPQQQPPQRQKHVFTLQQLEQKLVDVDISNDQAEEDSPNNTDAAMDDYAQNAQADGSDEDRGDIDLLLNSTFSRRALGGSHDEFDLGENSEVDDASTQAVRGGLGFILEKSRAQVMEDDEKLARLLAKQEELGIGGDDLGLFDEGYEEIVPVKTSNPSKAKGLSERNLMKSRKLKGPRPSAAEIADAFDDFDVFDWSRESLQKKNKNTLPVAADPDLEATMQSSYQKDRLKKAAKKQAREELRAQGLLRRNVDPNDPRIRYETGMVLEEVKKEMVAFLLSSDQQFSFPPMDANARKIIHEISIKLRIKSKSAGQGAQRHTTLHRTKQTIRYSAQEVDHVFDRIGRRHFPRMDGKGLGKGNAAGGRGGGAGQANVRDGDVVGGGAAEIGATNRGRTLLEKMGWSSGMSLGADNKGITQPIEHIVKKSKAGLG